EHFLVQGERGIGKSSLLLFIQALCGANEIPGLRDDLRFLVVSIDLGGCQNQIDIIRKIGRGLKQALADHQAASENVKEFWNWLTNWEVLGVRYHKQDEPDDPEEIADEMVAQFTKFLRSSAGL